MIRIASKIHGIEVAGMRHPMQTVHYQNDQIEPEQLVEFVKSGFLTVEVDGPNGESITLEPHMIETFDDETGGEDSGLYDQNTGIAADSADPSAAGEQPADAAETATVDQVENIDAAIEQTEAELVANAQPEPEQPASEVKAEAPVAEVPAAPARPVKPVKTKK